MIFHVDHHTDTDRCDTFKYLMDGKVFQLELHPLNLVEFSAGSVLRVTVTYVLVILNVCHTEGFSCFSRLLV